ncbi:glutamine-synthetase adenylyltransferase [Halocynthiibacter sp. C4]|uniref:[protein-PII] uridylyltransferase family protein n=1 Tax=Halocynthiibacter sp. C4 TaxID=2992758 RepID=UPI00237C300D|nr:glutamine-synthetase adenylyltransferase [Halocynthiibacter sp. C4]MDE0589764.1 glutamine-synthetase adenylyltransferase [Halocynthiibacter sp. C4]
MTFASRMTRSPIPYDLERSKDALACVPELAPEFADLVAGAGGCSPYLLHLMTREGDWLAEALAGSPEDALAKVFEDVRATAPDELGVALRVAKRRVALLAGLADLAGVWQLEDVTGALTDLADLAVDRAIKAEVTREAKRGKLPGYARDTEEATGGLVALAMGKMGAGELNYSSDIDLICLFDESQYDPDLYFDARTSLIRATKRMSALLNDNTAEGYVFRTDLRLRPDPSSTPVCMAMDPAERYYESLGRTWERAAHIKARAAAGDIEAGEAYLKRLSPFVWRKHLDFAAIQDAHDIRLKIRAHNGFTGEISLPEHNMKLGRGGIREIEFFTQTRQLIAGGRDKSLRVRSTVDGLAALAEKGWVEPETAEVLTDHYKAHREVEHRLQMIADAQTHCLPKTEEDFERLANFMGEGDVTKLKADIKARLEEVHHLTEGFFAPGLSVPEPELPEETRKIVEGWYAYPALRSARANEIFKRLKPDLLARIQKSARADEALRQFDGFLKGLPAGVQLFSLFEANPQLIDLILDIVGTSSDLASYLSRNSSVFDAVIGGSFFSDWPGKEALTKALTAQLAPLADYESRLDETRRWAKEWHFRIGVHHLRGLIDADQAGAQYADLADAVLAALWPVVCENFAEKHGPLPGRGAIVLGMGSLGAKRLHYRSDLDLIVIYDADGTEESTGRRPLMARAYYARLTQAFVTALTVPMAEGRLYEVDMRLRPSGKAGPVATSWAAYQSYQETEAWVWEYLALTRARPVAGSAELAADFDAFRKRVLVEKGDKARVIKETGEMRARIKAATPANSPYEAKLGQGRLQDVELTAQAIALMAGFDGRGVNAQIASGDLPASDTGALVNSGDLMWRLQAASRLLMEQPVGADEIEQGGREFLLRETGCSSVADMEETVAKVADQARVVIDRLFPVPEQD